MKRSAALAEVPFAARPEFLAFCGHWEAGGICPLVLADWLRDRGLDSYADAAAWAVKAGVAPHRARFSTAPDPVAILMTDGSGDEWQTVAAVWTLGHWVWAADTYRHIPLSSFPAVGGGRSQPRPVFGSFPEAAAILLRAHALAGNPPGGG